MAFRTLILVVLLCFPYISDSASPSSQMTLFGPESFLAQQPSRLNWALRNFNTPGAMSRTKIDLINGAGIEGFIEPCDLRNGAPQFAECLRKGLRAVFVPRKRADYVEIKLNGRTIVSERLEGYELSLSRNVQLQSANRLEVLVKGGRNGFVTTAELPHYHRRTIDSTTGQPAPGQGIGRHRPWDTRSTDRSFWDRF